jgi:hypothetical protein
MLFQRFAQTYMALLDCFAPSQNRRREAQEELLADLNTCIEQLNERMLEMEHRIARSHEQAVLHARMAKRAPTAVARSRDEQRARMHLRDRRRIQGEFDKAQRMLHMLESHIDGIVSSHVDTLIVQTMRSYNHTAARLAMPTMTGQVEDLAEELSERNRELADLQNALGGIASSSMLMPVPGSSDAAEFGAMADDGALMLELETLLMDEEPSLHPPPTTTTAAASMVVGVIRAAPTAEKEKEENEKEEEPPLLLPHLPLPCPDDGDEEEEEARARAMA